MTFTKVKDILPKVLNQNGLKRQAEAGLICEKWNQVVKDTLKKEVREQMKVISFKDGELKVAVLNSSVGQELQLHSHELKKKFNLLFEDKKITRIRIVS